MKANRNPKYSKRISTVETNAVLIHRNDWKRVKGESIHLTPQQQQELLKKENLEKKKLLDQITLKRSTLIDQQVRPEVKSHVHQVLEKQEERDYALQIAELKADEDLDEIKRLNSLIGEAKAKTIRHQQEQIVEEKRKQAKEEELKTIEYQEEMRKKAEDLYKSREKTLKEQRIKGRKVIDIQIEEHKINAILEAERRDREQKELNRI